VDGVTVTDPLRRTARVRRSDLARVSSRAFHLQALLSPERMQGLGFGFAILPVLRRLYPTAAACGEALKRHIRYFATHPVLSGYALGAAARLEERRANGEGVSEESIDGLKRALASPLAALGDPLFWVTLRPLAGVLGVIAVAAFPRPPAGEPDLRVLLCPLVTLLTYNAVALPYRFAGVARGYAEADRPDALLRSLKLSGLNAVLECAGAFAFGALVALLGTGLDFASSIWGESARRRVMDLTPLLLGAFIGFAGLQRWPGRAVEVALLALLAGAVLAAGT
jgi:PTS system mannose-specific IID component